jgi:predicted ribosomally synthesized peptide with SipW-like signal peptide
VTTGRKLFITAMVSVGVMAVVGAGSFATFTAQDKNPNNVFATGTLVLSDKVNNGTACLSTGGGSTDVNVNNNCDQVFNLTVRKPGDSGSGNLTLKDVGSLDMNTFNVFSQACTNSDASGENYHGTGSPCSVVDLTIQQYSDSNFSTVLACMYGGGNATTCAFDDTKTLATFQASYNNSSNGLSLGTLASGSEDYYKISVKMPTSAGNSYQGRAATIDFTWFGAQ